MPVTPVLCGQGAEITTSEVQDHPLLHSKFKASLGHMKSSQPLLALQKPHSGVEVEFIQKENGVFEWSYP